MKRLTPLLVTLTCACGVSIGTAQKQGTPNANAGSDLHHRIVDPNGNVICPCDPADWWCGPDGDGDSDDHCILCGEGNACVPTNPCHTGTLTCAEGPHCHDSGQNVADGTACGGGNVCQAGNCVAPCVPTTCAAQNAACGAIPDGCGGTLSCGTCGTNQACQSGACVTICTPTTCAAQNTSCGAIPDGCGGTLECGSCQTGFTCTAGACVPVCTPTTCAAQHATCGTLPDGCGGMLACGSCGGGATCGGGGTANVCGFAACTFELRFEQAFGQAWDDNDVAFVLQDGSEHRGIASLDFNRQKTQVPSNVYVLGSNSLVASYKLYQHGAGNVLAQKSGAQYIYGLGHAAWQQAMGYNAANYTATSLARDFALDEPSYPQLVGLLRVAFQNAEPWVPANLLNDYRTATTNWMNQIEGGQLSFQIGTGHAIDYWQDQQSINGNTWGFQFSTSFGMDPILGVNLNNNFITWPTVAMTPKCAGVSTSAYGGKTYRFFEQGQTYANAEAACRAAGGNLASLHDTHANSFVRGLAPNAGDTWLGLDDLATMGTYLWQDGSALDFTKWAPGQPDHYQGVEHCIQISDYWNSAAPWNDADCSLTKSFLCEQ